MRDTLCTKCRNPECEYAGRKVWVMICAHEYMAPPQTNADRIRAMSDEDLATWVETIAGCHLCPMLDEQCSGGEVNSRANCKHHWLEWLRQEA